MDKNTIKKISKFLSLVLRHQPATLGINLDEAGWISVDELLSAMNRHPGSPSIKRLQLEHVVETNDKQRFAFSDDGTRIRANQGHSVNVQLGYQAAEPPETLLHGTPAGSVESIRRSGLLKMQRHHVHLHIDAETSMAVGARRGKPVLLSIRAKEMHDAGHAFYVTDNNVWLTDQVPPKYIDFPA